MASDPRFGESIDKNRILTLFLGIVTSASIITLLALVGTGAVSTPRSYLLVSTLWALNGWLWVVAILGFGRRLLSFNHRFLETSNDLVLPFYILHQSIIVAIAFYVVGLNLIVVEKYILIVLTSFPIIAVLLYPIARARVNLLRFLFGSRLKKRPKRV
jgi:glucan biosynthesis protein C